MFRDRSPRPRISQRRTAPVFPAITLLLIATAAGVVAPSASAMRAPAPRALSGADIVTMWNAVAVDTVVVDAGKANVEAFYWFAIEQAAVYNAVVGITGRFELYRWDVTGPSTASQNAAAAKAAHTILLHYFPASEVRLDTALAASLDSVPGGTAKREGMRYGRLAARHIIDVRRNDGYGAPIPFDKPLAPGVWRPTPPTFTPFFGTWLSELEPFMLDSPEQFRPPAPPGLRTDIYTEDFHEVKAFGRATDSARTPKQTETAMFFSDVGIVPLQAGLRDLIERRGMDVSEAARLLAAVDMSIADTAITVWDSKLHYGYWRPVTAIELAADDGNPATVAEAGWTPLLTNPPYPEYASGLNGTIGSSARVLRRLTGGVDLVLTSTAAGVTRHYTSEAWITGDAIDSRVWSGIHFRTADEVAIRMGRKVADWAMDRYFHQR